jgi:putative flippase GtrA
MGCRKFTGNIPARSKFGNEITKKVFSLASGVKVSDTQTGLRGFSNEMIPFLLEVSGDRYEYEMNMLLECAKEKIQFFEVPIETVYIDSNESSHFNPIKDSVRIYKDILKFSCSSLLSFFVDYILYSVLLLLTDNLKVSNIGARVVSSCFNFTMNKRYVFRSKESILKTAVKYFALAACILAANTVLLELCTSYLIHNRFIAKILIEILLFFISWTVQKSFVFKKRKD